MDTCGPFWSAAFPARRPTVAWGAGSGDPRPTRVAPEVQRGGSLAVVRSQAGAWEREGFGVGRGDEERPRRGDRSARREPRGSAFPGRSRQEPGNEMKKDSVVAR